MAVVMDAAVRAGVDDNDSDSFKFLAQSLAIRGGAPTHLKHHVGALGDLSSPAENSYHAMEQATLTNTFSNKISWDGQRCGEVTV